ncbi:MAG: HAMP domain-containing histidine kinase [Lachnospiraceae bacterium]|nr:HAMP domain-containing histidine kinase [Lachnospiraceae bacterium]
MWIKVSIVLLVICVILLLYIRVLKRELRGMQEELKLTMEPSYNRQIRVALFDKDLTNFTTQLNHNLDYQKELKECAKESEIKMKQSISDIAHDLRTPLTVIKGNLQMLERSRNLGEKEQTYLNICLDKADTLKDMVDDFFEMSVLESDSIQAQLEAFDMTGLLVQFIIDNEALIREHHLEPTLLLPDKSVMVCANVQMVMRMLSNLLNNVLKYAKNAFSLRMREVQTDTHALCEITFSNRLEPHISLDVEHLFERTYRGEHARSGSGAGLGLYIVKLLADKQNAKVYATNKEEELEITMQFPIKNNV